MHDQTGMNFILFERKLLYLTLALSFFGSAFLSFSMGSFHLFPGRLALLVLLGFLVLRITSIGIVPLHIKAQVLFLGLWFLFAIVSMIWAPDLALALHYLTFLFFGMAVIFAMVSYIDDPAGLDTVHRIWVFVFAVVVLIGFWEHLTGNHLDTSGLYQFENPYPESANYVRLTYMPTGPFRNPNDLGLFFGLSFPLAFVRALRIKASLRRNAAFLLLAASLFVLIKTESRANYLAVGMGFMFWFIFLGREVNKKKALAGVGALILAISIILPGWITWASTVWNGQMKPLAHIWETDQVRRNLILFGLKSVETTMGIGLGAGGVEPFMSQYTDMTGEVTNLHNWWLEILADFGIPIFVGYVIFYIGLLISLYRIYRNSSSPQMKMIAEGLLMGWVGFFIGSISSSSIVALLPHWMFVGFILCAVNVYRKERRGTAGDARLDHTD
jgi:teichuronic acid biosynthesis protein TuaE